MRDAPVLIGVDGRSGAGKTTLADALVARLSPYADVSVLHVESFYAGWDGLAGVLEADGDYVRALRVLREGGTARWRAWDWHRGLPGEEHSLAPGDVVVCEGVGAASAAARPLLTLSVWLDLPEATRRERALRRDGEAYAPHWERWAAQEERYLAAQRPDEAADLRTGVGPLSRPAAPCPPDAPRRRSTPR